MPPTWPSCLCGNVQLCVTYRQIKRTCLFIKSQVIGRGEADHRLAEGNDIGHGFFLNEVNVGGLLTPQN
jgi:hypothetical protein